MSTANDILGLSHGERDPAVIRRAYAAQLKQHRPDQDPDGFRRVREAYLALMGQAGPVAGTPPTAAAMPTPADAPAATRARPTTAASRASSADRDRSDSWDAATAALGAAVGAKAGREAAIATALRTLEDLLLSHLTTAGAWSQTVVDHLGAEPELLVRLLRDDALTLDAAEGPGDLVGLVLGRASAVRDTARLTSFARQWLTRLDDTTRPTSRMLQITLRLAVDVAVVDYPLATRLMSHLTHGVVGHQLAANDAHLDLRLHLGHDLCGMPDDIRAYLDRALAMPMRWWEQPALHRRMTLMLNLLPLDSFVRMALPAHSPGLIPPTSSARRTVFRVTVLGVLFTLLMVVIEALVMSQLLALFEPLGRDDQQLAITLSVAGLGVALFFPARWFYLRLEDPFYRRVWTPLDRLAGPFDLVFVLWSLWLWGGTPGMLWACLQPDLRWAVPVWLASPVLSAVPFARLRRAIDPGHGHRRWRRLVPPWAGMTPALTQVVGQVFVLLPALLIATVTIAGTANAAGFSSTDGAGGFRSGAFWSGPFLLVFFAAHAWWREWQATSPRRWHALAWWLGWCLAWPAAALGFGLAAGRLPQPWLALATISIVASLVVCACRFAPAPTATAD